MCFVDTVSMVSDVGKMSGPLNFPSLLNPRYEFQWTHSLLPRSYSGYPGVGTTHGLRRRLSSRIVFVIFLGPFNTRVPWSRNLRSFHDSTPHSQWSEESFLCIKMILFHTHVTIPKERINDVVSKDCIPNVTLQDRKFERIPCFEHGRGVTTVVVTDTYLYK